RPHTAIGTYGQIGVRRRAGRFLVAARYREADGRLRVVTARGESQSAAKANLKLRLLNRSGYGTSGRLSLSSSFGDLVALWLTDLELQDLVEPTKENYRDDIRLHVLPSFQYFTLGEITTGRVERFLKSELAVSYSRAKHPHRRCAAGGVGQAARYRRYLWRRSLLLLESQIMESLDPHQPTVEALTSFIEESVARLRDQVKFTVNREQENEFLLLFGACARTIRYADAYLTLARNGFSSEGVPPSMSSVRFREGPRDLPTAVGAFL
ncbi:MAG: hypothetical protein JWQ59_2390, partial [Cryobacterium sp.]|nr:hypothetical protein [Cryobacterium sp.]